jgi:outer membrane protein assembly factor BamB
MTPRFRINTPHVVAETLDGEATIVDLDSGTYYALNESGSLIWDGLIAGSPPSEVAATLAGAYELEADDATRSVEDLVKKLAEANLIVDASEAGQNGATPAASAPSSNGSRRQYAEPELSAYTDMQELLLLDPIHEVDESGWPSQP